MERRLPKRSVAKDGNKAKRARRGGKAGCNAVDSVTKEGRVSVAPTMPTEAVAVAVPETAEAEKEGSLAVGTAAETEAVEKEKERSLASETDAVENEVDAGALTFFSGAGIIFFIVCL